MQRGKSVKQSLIVIMLLFFTCLIYSQKKIQGVYWVDYELKDFGKSFTFQQNGIFKTESSGHLGVTDYAKGHYFIKNDSLILNYNLTELKTNDYHTYKYYANNKDTFKVKITIRDMNSSPLNDIAVLSLQNKIDKTSDKNGIIEFSLKKRKEKIKIFVANDNLGYYFSIWANKNYEIDVFLRQDNYATAFKGDVFKYKIIKLAKEEIKLKTQNSVLVLKKGKQ